MLSPGNQLMQDTHEASSSYVRVGPLLRATGPYTATIWLELTTRCLVTLDIVPFSTETSSNFSSQQPSPESTNVVRNSVAHTVTVGGRYYAALYIEQLQPATWYSYRISISKDDTTTELPSFPIRHFRTMNVPSQAQNTPLRVAYGSCRKDVSPRTDALSALGRWLRNHWEQRETVWPHLLLLIGDQIYADQPPDVMLQAHPELKDGARTFEEFALLYSYLWTADPDVRQALAVLPTYLIFDDHEITNNWNQLPQWCASMLASGHEQLIVDGLVAYWVYQGWGNIARQQDTQHPLLCIMQEAQGEDVIEQLRDEIRHEVRGEVNGHWHYDIATEPPIFVMNARSERTSIFNDNEEDMCAPTRILSKAQMTALQEWMQQHDSTVSILVSSVPIILPPVIGFAEYITGVRFLHGSVPGRWLAHVQQRLADRLSFDHWPTYSQTWREIVQLLSKRRHDIVALSGDVHFSYAIEARASRRARMLQLVSTPLENKLGVQDKQIIVRQSIITRLWYGGLRMRMLSMLRNDDNRPIQRGMLFQNAIAYVTFTPNRAGNYLVQQEYLAVVDGELQVVGRTKIPTR